jgi:hypothetical protein
MGWEQRGRRKRAAEEFPHLQEHFRALALRMRASIQELGVTLKPSNPLDRMVRDLEWVAALAAGPLKGGDLAIARRYWHALLDYYPLLRIAASLTALSQIANHEQYRRVLSEQVNLLDNPDSAALDRLFEVEVAARLASQVGVTVAFEEPDVVAAFPPAPPFALACKRPRRLKRIGDALRSAKQQIRRAGIPGVVVLGIERLFYQKHDGDSRARVLLETKSGSSRAVATHWLEQATAAGDAALKQVDPQRDRVYGVIYFAAFPYVSGSLPSEGIAAREQVFVTQPGWEVVVAVRDMLTNTPGTEWAGLAEPKPQLSIRERADRTNAEALSVAKRALIEMRLKDPNAEFTIGIPDNTLLAVSPATPSKKG